MFWTVIPLTLYFVLAAVQGQQSQSSCKDPAVAKRLLADDVRFASPFYVVALPRNSETSQMDNVCYTYFETGGESFNHIISVTYKDGSNKYHRFTKGDIPGSMGLAEAKAEGTSCTYHDYTLIPVCNSTVFVLYRCFLEGSCNSIDIGASQGVDTRVALAATPTVSQDCYKELEMNLKDTSSLNGGDYIILPQGLAPQCVTKYNDTYSIGYQRSAGTKEVTGEDPNQRFGGDDEKTDVKIPQKNPEQTPPKPAQPTWSAQGVPMKVRPTMPPKGSYNPSGTSFHTSMSGPGHSSSFSFSQASSGAKPGVSAWQQQNHWSQGPNPWSQYSHPGEAHYHTWQGQGPAVKPNANNVFYHVHNWENPPPNCCKCN